MCNPMLFMAAGAGAQAAGASNAAKAQKSSLLYDAQVADNNATIAEWQAQDAIRSGQLEEQGVRMQAAAVKASQRASMAANGIALDEGSAVDVLTSTDYLEERDALTVRDNALKSAWGYRTQGTNFADSARNARAGAKAISPTAAAATSLLGSAGQVASTWYGMNKAGVATNGGYNYAYDETGSRFSATGADVRARR